MFKRSVTEVTYFLSLFAVLYGVLVLILELGGAL
jgi:hypothetical protein